MNLSISYVIARAVSIIAILVALIYGYGFFKKYQRKSATIADLQAICGESSYFRQFSAADAHKTLARAIGLIAEADSLGINPNDAIDSALGEKREWYEEKPAAEDIPAAKKIIQASLRANYDNFVKLGFTTDFNTIKVFKSGELPPISSGVLAGRKPIIRNLIPMEASPGIEKVIANLELAPPESAAKPLTDIQLAASKQLARDLYSARIIEQSVSTKIIEYLTPENERKKK